MMLSLVRALWRLNRNQWASPVDIEALQVEKLQRQVLRAWEYSPFYREKLRSCGFHPQDLKSLSDLHKLPIITKSELKSAGSSILCSDINPKSCVWLSTSGSSGSPISLPFTHQDKTHRVLKELRSLIALGYRFTDRTMAFVEPKSMVSKKILVQRIGLLRREYISVFADEKEQLLKLKSIRPHLVYGYTSSLRTLAEALLHGDQIIPPPRIIITSAELINAGTRQIINEAFGISPVDFYGSMEFGWIAWQCPERSGYHINSDCLIVECIKDGHQAAEGEEGELVITNLHSNAAPIIRYATGDTGVLSKELCPCGRSLPLLHSIHGRLADRIILPDGRKMSPYAVTCAIELIPGVRQFQVVQEQDGGIIIRLVNEISNDEKQNMRRFIRDQLKVDIKVDVETLPSLPLERSGKFKVVSSLLDSELQ